MNYPNEIIERLCALGEMSFYGREWVLEPTFAYQVDSALSAAKMSCEFHFDGSTGKIIFTKVLGRDENGDFFNEENTRTEDRKTQMKQVIVTALVNKCNAV